MKAAKGKTVKKKFSEAKKQLQKDRESVEEFLAEKVQDSKEGDINKESFPYQGFVAMPNWVGPDVCKCSAV